MARMILLSATLALVCAAASVRAEDPPPIAAFSAWQGRGQVFETGPNRITFVGSFSGIVFVQGGMGPVDAGYMTCPAVVDINVEDGKEQAKGRCTITAKDGARLYADLACEGVRMVGCNGEFTITGGT